MRQRIEEVLAFWFRDCCDDPRRAAAMNETWFAANDSFDGEIRDRFRALCENAAADALDNWRVTARGSLALTLLLDQFPRNMYRGSARAFATDAAALAICKRGLERDFLAALRPPEQVFFSLPLSHSEQRFDQDRCVEIFDGLLGECPAEWRAHLGGAADFARQHREVVLRFGRFPHRNRILDRVSTPEEIAYLEGGGALWGQ